MFLFPSRRWLWVASLCWQLTTIDKTIWHHRNDHIHGSTMDRRGSVDVEFRQHKACCWSPTSQNVLWLSEPVNNSRGAISKTLRNQRTSTSKTGSGGRLAVVESLADVEWSLFILFSSFGVDHIISNRQPPSCFAISKDTFNVEVERRAVAATKNEHSTKINKITCEMLLD
jgi:hypothetical protein